MAVRSAVRANGGWLSRTFFRGAAPDGVAVLGPAPWKLWDHPVDASPKRPERRRREGASGIIHDSLMIARPFRINGLRSVFARLWRISSPCGGLGRGRPRTDAGKAPNACRNRPEWTPECPRTNAGTSPNECRNVIGKPLAKRGFLAPESIGIRGINKNKGERRCPLPRGVATVGLAWAGGRTGGSRSLVSRVVEGRRRSREPIFPANRW